MFRNFKTTSAALLATTFLVGGAHAATVSYNGSTGPVGGLGFLTLQQFDPVLGTLTGIDIDWTIEFDARFAVVPENPGDAGTASAADDFVTATMFNTASPSAGTSVGPFSATGGSAFSVSVPPNYSQDLSGSSTASSSFGPAGAFIGLGTVGYDFFGTASDTSTVDSGLLRGLPEFSYTVSAEVTYTYEVDTPAIPLPAGAPLLVAGLGAFALMRKKRKS